MTSPRKSLHTFWNYGFDVYSFFYFRCNGLNYFPIPLIFRQQVLLFPNVAEIPIVLSFGIRNLRYEIANSV